jgi:hypothetical protein
MNKSVFSLLAWLPLIAAARPLPLVFRCAPDNDLYRVLAASGARYARYDSPADAVAGAPRGAGVLILADGYPEQTTALSAAVFEQAAKKKLRLYVEYPSELPGLTVGGPRGVRWERAVVSSEAFGPALEKLRILGIQNCRFVPVRALRNADIVIARVAGFDRAVYGLPAADVQPILFEHNDVLVSTTKLSQFVTARYAPTDAWGPIWQHVLRWLGRGRAAPELKWTPSVHPAFARGEKLPADVEAVAFRRGSEVYARARFFVHPAWQQEYEKAVRVNESVAGKPRPDWPLGDGSGGVLEGFASNIRMDGSQPVRYMVRNDCTGEVSFQMALASRILNRPSDARVAANLSDYIYFHSQLSKGPRADPQSPSFGLLGWSYPSSLGVFYGDDNARSMLGTIGAAAVLNSDRWDKFVLRCLLANLRTTGRLGFRDSRLDEGPLHKNGWPFYFNSGRTNYAPHYEAYLWACFLWAYHMTGYQPFLDRTETAIRMTMEAYPADWHWTNGIQQERARMLLPLAWLVRIQDTSEHRQWLRKIAGEMLAFQDPSGAIREELGAPGKGDYGPPKSNEAYGTREATLISRNGDPLCDLLYTTNFAFLGLHEAAAATGEALYTDAEEKLAKFLGRVQVRSEVHPELDGWWYRAFEYQRWDYWGSNADAGWGVWSTESGWTQAWIASVLGMRQMKTSFWDLTAASRIGRHLDGLLPQMFPTP